MKPEQIYQGLIDLADRLSIVVSEQKLSTENLKVKSGLCKIKGQFIMILDKQLSIHKKCAILATCLSDMPHDSIFIIPAVREFLAGHRKPVLPENIPGQRIIRPEDGMIQSQ
ncbi:MAG: hypothetical protein NTU74_14205 [Deltaproteobacteria bacterium]|nr:hypothetical protein [Deltaproteobacteria bacterium]